MKIKDLIFSKFSYKRICVISSQDTKYYPECSEECVVREHGNMELDSEVIVDEAEWLILKIKVE